LGYTETSFWTGIPLLQFSAIALNLIRLLRR
jgi:hypothetical protein